MSDSHILHNDNEDGNEGALNPESPWRPAILDYQLSSPHILEYIGSVLSAESPQIIVSYSIISKTNLTSRRYI